ncbi:hypothetical protein Syun_003842 [Stephania yunnanensis]|uniref:Uncharacterized protein n=1 Tax=Stephania yunnanensis TaxID=152371 RepID=A0AAP0Q0Y1_9MAGN
MNSLVYVMTNLKLREQYQKRPTISDPLCFEDVDSDEEWILDDIHVNASEESSNANIYINNDTGSFNLNDEIDAENIQNLNVGQEQQTNKI